MKKFLLFLTSMSILHHVDAQTYETKIPSDYKFRQNFDKNEGLDTVKYPNFTLQYNGTNYDLTSGLDMFNYSKGALKLLQNISSVVDPTTYEIKKLNSVLVDEGTICFSYRLNNNTNQGHYSTLTYQPIMIIPNGANSYFEGLFLGAVGTASQPKLRIGGGSASGFGFEEVNATGLNYSNVMTNVAITYKNNLAAGTSVVKLYINGEFSVEKSLNHILSFDNTRGPVFGGIKQGSSMAKTNMQLDNFFVYDRNLTDEEIENMYEANYKLFFDLRSDVSIENNEMDEDLDGINNDEYLNNRLYNSQTYDNNVMLTNDRFGNAYSAINNYSKNSELNLHNVASYYDNADKPFSTSMWVRDNDSTASSTTVDGIIPFLGINNINSSNGSDDDDAVYSFLFGRRNDELVLRMATPGGTNTHEEAKISNVDWTKWNFVAAEFIPGESIKVFLNGSTNFVEFDLSTLGQISFPYSTKVKHIQLLSYKQNGNSAAYLGTIDDFYFSVLPFKTGEVDELFGNYVEADHDTDLAVDAINTKNYSVFPNPTTNSFKVRTELTENFSVTILDATGKTVKQFNNVNAEQVLSIEELNSGVHMATINSISSTEVIRLIKK